MFFFVRYEIRKNSQFPAWRLKITCGRPLNGPLQNFFLEIDDILGIFDIDAKLS